MKKRVKKLNARQKLTRLIVYTMLFLTVELSYGFILMEMLVRIFK